MCFEIIQHLIENDNNGIYKMKIVRTATFKVLANMIVNVFDHFGGVKAEYTSNTQNNLEYGF